MKKIIPAIILIANVEVLAEEIYESTTPSGVRLFSSAPLPRGKKADLPLIMRDSDIRAKSRNEAKIVDSVTKNSEKENSVYSTTSKTTNESCETHGGISCESGKDKDGSVICADGYLDSKAPFNLRCSGTKLSIIDIKEGQFGKNNKAEYTVFLRNNGSKKTNSPNLAIIKEGYKVISTEEGYIEPNGMGEVKVTIQKDPRVRYKLLKEHLVINQ